MDTDIDQAAEAMFTYLDTPIDERKWPEGVEGLEPTELHALLNGLLHPKASDRFESKRTMRAAFFRMDEVRVNARRGRLNGATPSSISPLLPAAP